MVIFGKERKRLTLLCVVGLVLLLLIACAPAAEPTPKPVQPTPTTAPAPTVAQPTTPLPKLEPTPKPVATPAAVPKYPISGLEFGKAPVPTTTPKYGGTLKLSGDAEAPGFDMHLTTSYKTAQPISMTHDKLVEWRHGAQYGPTDLTVAPSLAERWEMPDSKTYIFYLRKGVKWHNKPPANGRELVADDVKWTFDRMIAKKSVVLPPLGELDKVEVVDRYTVKFSLKVPYVPFLTNMGSAFYAILCKEAAEPTEDGWGDFR